MTTGSRLVDHARFDALTEGRAEIRQEITELLNTEGRRYLASASVALEQGDADGVRRAAHALFGAAANVGANRLAELCRQLDHEARAGALSRALVREMTEVFEATKAELRRTAPDDAVLTSDERSA